MYIFETNFQTLITQFNVNKFMILMWPIVGFFEKKIICSVDFIYIELFTRII